MKTINDIDLGDFSAENDINLSKYFLEDTTSYKAAEKLSDHRYILVGRTGSGKSAILSHIDKKFKNDDRYICAFIRPGKSYLDAVIQTQAFHEIKQVKGLDNILYKLIWQYVIMISVLKAKYGAQGPLKKTRLLKGDDLKAYKFLSKVEQLTSENKTLIDIIADLVNEINISIKGVSISGKRAEKPYDIMHDLIKESESFHQKGFWEVVGGSKLYLLFDDLDLGWNPKDESQQSLLQGLFMIMKDYAYRERVKPLIALRTNIINGLKIPQREKFENNILSISWTKETLENMLSLRLSGDEDIQRKEPIKHYFYINNQDNPLDYMINRTLYRPRDLLAFCKYALEEAICSGSTKISQKSVLDSETKYSRNRVQALADEWSHLYSDLDLLCKVIVKIISRESSDKNITPRKMRDILIEVKERILTAPESSNPYQNLMWFISYFPEDDHPYEIVRILFRLGLIGYREGKGRYIYSYENVDIGEITASTEFIFHPILSNLPTGGISFNDENPWK